MIEYRQRALVWLVGRTLNRVGGGGLQLVTECRTDEGAGEICDEHGQRLSPTASVLAYPRPDEARELAFWRLEVAELAEGRSELTR